MALERNLSAVPPVLLIADGNAHGAIHVADTKGFYVKSLLIIQAPSIPPTHVEIKRIVDHNKMLVGLPGSINLRSDLSVYTVVAGSFVFAVEQPKAKVDMETRMLASYQQEPSNSWRVSSVDPYGDEYSPTNPMPVAINGTISIGQVEVKGSTGDIIEPNPDGSLNVFVKGGLTPSDFDDVKIIRDSNDNPTQYQFYLASVLISSINVTYNANTSAIEYKRV